MQHNSHNKKESFKLLQLSDDSKSLSELELPQVSTVQNQRKRKILRKTRNTSPHSSRLAAAGYHTHAHDAATSSDGLITSACSTNFGLWIAVMMTCGWLFILSYMTAVVYSENRRLEAQLFKLSATSQTVPDELQRWHESAKWLEQNQTALQTRLGEADVRAAALGKDVQALRAEFAEKYNDASDHDKVFRLQKNVANLGAQLKDLNITVVTLKEHTDPLRIDIDNNTSTLRALDLFAHSNAASLGGDGARGSSAAVTNASVLWLVHNATDDMRAQLQGVFTQIDGGKYAIEQRATHLEDDMQLQKTNLGALSEMLANVTAQVASIELRLREHAVVVQPAAATAPDVKRVQPLATTTTTTTTTTPTVDATPKAPPLVGPAVPAKLDADLLSALSERSSAAAGRR